MLKKLYFITASRFGSRGLDMHEKRITYAGQILISRVVKLRSTLEAVLGVLTVLALQLPNSLYAFGWSLRSTYGPPCKASSVLLSIVISITLTSNEIYANCFSDSHNRNIWVVQPKSNVATVKATKSRPNS